MRLKFLGIAAVAALIVSCSSEDGGQKFSNAELVGKWHFVKTAYKDSVTVVYPANGPCGQDFAVYTESGSVEYYKVSYVNYEGTGPQCFASNPGAGLENNTKWKISGDKIVWWHYPDGAVLYSQKILKMTSDTLVVKTGKNVLTPSNPESITTYVKGQ